MDFAKTMMALPKRQQSAVLMLEGSLTGAAKLAKQTLQQAKSDSSSARGPEPERGPRHRSHTGAGSPAGGDTPSDAPESPQNAPATKGRDESSKEAPAPETEGEEPESPSKPAPAKKLDRSGYYQLWDKAIGPLVRLVDKIAEGVGERHDPHHEAIQEALNTATEEMMAWMEVKA
jgi:hypothetical protein